ncbi:MAG: hypothetical protein CM15mP130_2230 [Verrucomicrobiota bacterium]|nr:MAG: hypothetical protein CM15mP130_2230 [Verrucomicrobiota bacterium]
MRLLSMKLFLLLGIVSSLIGLQEREGKVELSVRASAINPGNAKEHPGINTLCKREKINTRTCSSHCDICVRPVIAGNLVDELQCRISEYLASLGLHLIQPHYANRWFSTVPKETHDTGECLGNIRLGPPGRITVPSWTFPRRWSGCPFAEIRPMVGQRKPRRKMGTIS